MPIININIKNKIANGNKEEFIVCDNSDYEILFDFDQEWEKYNNKTAIVTLSNREFVPILFQGNKCKLPPFPNVMFCKVGVTASIENADETITLSTTTPATINCLESAYDENGNILPPTDDIYQQILAKLNSIIEGSGGTTVTVGGVEQKTWDADNKLDKITETTLYRQAYVKMANGEQGMTNMSYSPVYNAIPLYTVDKNLKTETPKANNDCANMQYVDDGLSGKLDIFTVENKAGNKLYRARADGSQDTVFVGDASDMITQYYSETKGDTAPRGYLWTNTPTKPYHCANKGYVDAQKVYKHRTVFNLADESIDFRYLTFLSTSSEALEEFRQIPDGDYAITNEYGGYGIIAQISSGYLIGWTTNGQTVNIYPDNIGLFNDTVIAI
jgi:hypothetical protein